MRRLAFCVTLAAALPGCREDAARPPEDPALRVSMVAGDDQQGGAGEELPVSASVRVTGPGGAPVAAMEVWWQVLEGGGTVAAERTATGSDGMASVAWRLGDDLGRQLLFASVAGSPGVTFRAWSNLFFSSISAGWRHSCALDTRGYAWCWGSNQWGQLGNGSRRNASESQPVAGRRAFQAVVAGGLHSCALTAAGDAFCWGDNGSGQLGDGSNAGSSVPVPVSGGHHFRNLSLGSTHTCAIELNGELYCWGSNLDGQIGIQSAETCPLGTWYPACVRQPARVTLAAAATRVAAGETHTCALLADGTGYCWGANDWGQLGRGGFGGNAMQPARLFGEGRYREVTAASRSTCALDSYGRAFCWGMNAAGELGTGDLFNQDRPTPVASTELYLEIGMGDDHTCARTQGAVHCWGMVLGNGSTQRSLVPVEVTGGSHLGTITVGGAHACGYGEGIWCWGTNAWGQLGVRTDSIATATVPLQVRRGPAGTGA